NDIKALVDATRGKALLKVIIETCLLTDEEIVKVSELCVKAGAEFVKTSTGFSTSGANEHVVALMKKTVGDKAKVKASGGIRDKATALKMIELGADRLGVSASVKIISE
ncbi:MAG: deoxyribose-phosphate aldolase, partial [Parvimonas micra]|nr:deoxyribose-phosphate aldolase [Parvimonas micra]